jgi:hypothetical protein
MKAYIYRAKNVWAGTSCTTIEIHRSFLASVHATKREIGFSLATISTRVLKNAQCCGQ